MDSAPVALADLSPAQRHVFVTLKRRGEASADELAEALGITPSAVRQHLAALRSAGLVASRQERGRPGRPTDLYHSTDLGEALFAGSSGDLSVELLGHIEEEDPELVTRIFERRRRRRVEQARDQLAGKSLDEKVAVLAKILDGEGYLADFDKLADGSYRMTLHSCAIWGVATRYGQACTTELDFLQELLSEAKIERVAHKLAGAYLCGYEIRPLQSASLIDEGGTIKAAWVPVAPRKTVMECVPCLPRARRSDDPKQPTQRVLLPGSQPELTSRSSEQLDRLVDASSSHLWAALGGI